MKYSIILFLSLFIVSCNTKYKLIDLQKAVENSDTQLVSNILKDKDIYTENDLIKLANISINKSKNFEILRLLCENGLSVDAPLQIKNGNYITEKRLLHLAIEYDKSEFINYLLMHNADITFPYHDYHDFICYCFSNFKNKDLSFLINSINEDNYNKVDLVDLCRICIVDQKYDTISMMVQKDYIKEAISNNSGFAPIVLLNYSDELMNKLSSSFNLQELNYSNQKSCLENSIMSLNHKSLQFAIKCGVDPTIALDWYGESCTLKEYIENYINHDYCYSDKEKVSIKQSMFKVLAE